MFILHLSAYELWLSLGNSGTETDFVASLKGDKGERGEQGLQGLRGEKGEIGLNGEKGEQGENGRDGVDGRDGKSSYETWISLGNSGTETDFIASLKGDKGDTGERGLQGIQGEKGADGIDGFSPTIEVSESTDNSYKLLITDKKGSFETPNLKEEGGSSGDGTSVTVDSKLSGTSENPVQNKVISSEISILQNQISNLNDLISSIQTSGGNLKVTTLFDSSDHEKYKDSWNFKCSHWDDRVFSFDETTTKNTAFCNSENGYSIRFSNSFGWGADVTALCSEAVQISGKSVMIVDYNCSSDGDGMTAEIVSMSDFTSPKTGEFEAVPAFYAVNTYLSSNFRLVSALENGSYYLRLKVNTTNPTFTIRKISVVSQG
ncbi:MAG: collagen-like protein [Ruminococcus sp.]|nr:collagen-like protein [Ruminococcus sp.]